MSGLLRRCHRCDFWITDGEPFEIDDIGYAHTTQCGTEVVRCL